ncbi:hypothetical protein F3J23_20180 [Chryseobacterium sp. Tr-659]|uniref:hypothetical protein n=1 Tax=Chryseobacterium sp. Tr-659 TaxID=2608340 RepID=UPI001420929E|nr:hypothetical protein [Chryseobacterium sp. Tr-659]NIF07749.1 hypothetical protein [Chryseobacterium sp. Tr-659]
MEKIIQHREQLQYTEAYISDMGVLKNIFQQIQNCRKINQNFGLPFLLAKKDNEIIAFASLVMNEKKEISFKIYDKKGMPDTEKRSFISRIENYFKKNNTPNFRDPEQLKMSISRMVSWLNLE